MPLSIQKYTSKLYPFGVFGFIWVFFFSHILLHLSFWILDDGINLFVFFHFEHILWKMTLTIFFFYCWKKFIFIFLWPQILHILYHLIMVLFGKFLIGSDIFLYLHNYYTCLFFLSLSIYMSSILNVVQDNDSFCCNTFNLPIIRKKEINVVL